MSNNTADAKSPGSQAVKKTLALGQQRAPPKAASPGSPKSGVMKAFHSKFGRMSRPANDADAPAKAAAAAQSPKRAPAAAAEPAEPAPPAPPAVAPVEGGSPAQEATAAQQSCSMGVAAVSVEETDEWKQTIGAMTSHLKRKQDSIEQLLADVAQLSKDKAALRDDLSCSQADLVTKSNEVDSLNKRVHWMGVILKSIVSENADSLNEGSVLGQLMARNQQSILNCAAGDVGFLIDDICTPSKRTKASE